jgi:hypothetical protein
MSQTRGTEASLYTQTEAQYAFRTKRLRTLLERLPGGHRPPTGPLTSAEKTEAEELRRETLVKENERIERGQEERRG